MTEIVSTIDVIVPFRFLAWRLPFLIQFVWPIPLLICFILAPESPYFLVRMGRLDEARTTLRRIGNKDITDEEIEQTIALIDYTNRAEVEESSSSSYAECFRGKNLWRTEIVSSQCVYQKTFT